MTMDAGTGYPRLVLAWASQSQLTQRRGRAGRVDRDGRVYRLVPEAFARGLAQDHPPEILRVPLTKVVLDVKLLNLGPPKDLLALAMDPPEVRSMVTTVTSLKEMGALLATAAGRQVREDGDLTVLGEVVARLPLDVRLGKLIVLGHIFGVLQDAVVIACGLNGKSIFTAPFDRRVQAYKNKLMWADRTFSDCFAILLAFQTWVSCRERGEFAGRDGVVDREEAWCRDAFLQRKQLEEMATLVEEVTRSLDMMDIKPLQTQRPLEWEGERKFLVLRLVMFGAFYPNYFTKVKVPEVERMAHRCLEGRDPRNTVYLQSFDQAQAAFGPLYADQIKRLLRAAAPEEEGVQLSFRGSTIFVEFPRRLEEGPPSLGHLGSMAGDISTQVRGGCQSPSGPLNSNKLTGPEIQGGFFNLPPKKVRVWNWVRHQILDLPPQSNICPRLLGSYSIALRKFLLGVQV